MKLFTVGPTQMHERTLEVSGRQVPYFRNQEFSDVVFDCERLFRECAKADADARLVILTASGTGAMEAVVMNYLGKDDRALVVNGGSFGARFAQICDIHGVPHSDIVLEPDEQLEQHHLDAHREDGCTALLVNLDETSTGQLYDLDMLAAFAKENGLFFVVDAISAFASDPINFQEAGIDALIVSSQKALAIAPGIALVLLSGRAVERLEGAPRTTLYFDFNDYLLNGVRGQTPFTPAVGIIYELQDRLHAIKEAGGIDVEVERVTAQASDFRERISDLPLSVAPFRKSNAVTRIVFEKPIAKTVCAKLKADYGFVLNPCGGAMADTALRVAHIGDLTIEDNKALAEALKVLVG